MEYHIRIKTVVGAKTAESQYKRIASFEDGVDRGICFDALKEYYPDTEFDTEND